MTRTISRMLRSTMLHVCNLSRCAKLLLGLFVLVLYCEFIVYYVTLLRCSWPALAGAHQEILTGAGGRAAPLKVMVMADTHLLGYREGHWFDKLRREWQMERSFQSTMTMHNPDLIFVLGDLIDEGKWADDTEFNVHINRFKRMFAPPSDSSVQVVVGNHDIGFHHATDAHKLHRFEEAFGTKSVRLLSVKGNVFVVVNSMALDGDQCNMCTDARQQLHRIERLLRCSKEDGRERNCTKDDVLPGAYSQPLLLQHFPLYRESDAECDTADQAPPDEKYVRFRAKWDSLSQEATNEVLRMLEPRLVLSAHTHHGCYTEHRAPNGSTVPEWTVASFSWRNKPQPTFLLLVVSNSHYAVAQCFLPHENTVVYLYCVIPLMLLVWFLSPLCLRSGLCSAYRKTH